MKDRCKVVLTETAKKLGRDLKTAELKNIERKANDMLKVLHNKDPEVFSKMTTEERYNKVGEMIAKDLEHNAAKNAQRQALSVAKDYSSAQRLQMMMATGLTGVKSIMHQLGFIADDKGGVSNVESRAKVFAQKYISRMDNLLAFDAEGSFLGLMHNKTNRDAFIKEVLGEDSGNPKAKELAKEFKSLNDDLLREYNEMGGDIANLKDWLPQNLDMFRVYGEVSPLEWAKLSKPEQMKLRQKRFVDVAMQHIDRSKYYDTKTGELFTDQQMRDFLNESWWSISTDGYTKQDVTRKEFASMIANRHKQHRQLHWKNADSHIAILEQFGAGEITDQIKSHITSLAREMALMDQFGPNAIHVIGQRIDEAREADMKAGTFDVAEMKHLERMVDYLTGKNAGVSGSVTFHKYARMWSDANVATLLGSLLTSQIGDNGTALATARAVGASYAQWGDWKTKFYKNSEMKEFAKSAYVATMHANDVAIRLGSEMTNSNFWGKAANTVMKATGAQYFTNAHRTSFASFVLDYVGGMTRRSDWNSLDEHSKLKLEGAGITEQDWRIYQAAETNKTYGGNGLGAKEISDIPLEKVVEITGLKGKAAKQAQDEATIRLTAFALQESEMAVLNPSLYVKTTNWMDYEKGTVKGELGNAFMQFKTFPIAMVYQHMLQRATSGGVANPYAYNLELLAMAAIFGGIGLVLNDVAQGKDPREIFTDKKRMSRFGMEAIAKGGGLGIFSNLMQADFSGRDPIEQLAGPTFSKAMNIAQFGKKAYNEAFGVKDENLGKALLDISKDWTPGQNYLFTRAIFHNYLMASMYEYAQPGYAARMRGLAEKNLGSQYYMGYGVEPRMPNFGNIAGGQ